LLGIAFDLDPLIVRRRRPLGDFPELSKAADTDARSIDLANANAR